MKRVIFLCIIILSSFRAESQVNAIFGVGLSGGAMNYKGDLDDKLSLIFTRPGGAIHFTYLPESNWNYSISYLHGSLECEDKHEDISRNKYRNLSFYTSIHDVSAIVIYRFKNLSDSFSLRPRWMPYVFAGLGLFHFNPKRMVDGEEYDLQKIGTEGQYLEPPSKNYYPKPYSLWQVSFPFGAGLKVRVTRVIDIGIETCLKKTFTDYLDDVSRRYPDKDKLLEDQGPFALYLSDSSNDPRRPNGKLSYSKRGNPEKKDWFIYTSVSLTYYFTTKLKRIVF